MVNILGIKRAYATFVPKDLNLLKNLRRVEVAIKMSDIVAGKLYECEIEIVQQANVRCSKGGIKPKATKLTESTEGHPSRSF